MIRALVIDDSAYNRVTLSRMLESHSGIKEDEPRVAETPLVAGNCAKGIELVAIGCSTGGPPALQHVFQSLSLLPLPIIVAQHMPSTFTRLFAERVNRLSAYNVKEADDGELLAKGTVYIAPGGLQTEVMRVPGAQGARGA